jgi:hypothetical protein
VGEGVVIDFLIDVTGLVILVSFVASLFPPPRRWFDRHQAAQLRFAVFAFTVYLADVTVAIFDGVRWPYLRLMLLVIVGQFIRTTSTIIRAQRAAGTDPRHPSSQP